MKSKVGINGKMTSGKTTLADHLIQQFNYQVISVATPMKQLATMFIDRVDQDQIKSLSDQLFLNNHTRDTAFTHLQCVHRDFSHLPFTKDEKGNYHKTDSYRAFLQAIGSTVRAQDEIAWVRYAATHANQLADQGLRIVCDDIRTKDEKQTFEHYGFVIVRLDVDEDVQDQRLLEMYGEINHARKLDKTETDLDNESFDFRINNSHISTDQTREAVVRFLQQ